MTHYRIEFGPAWPVPPITVDYSDRTAAARQVAAQPVDELPAVVGLFRTELQHRGEL